MTQYCLVPKKVIDEFLKENPLQNLSNEYKVGEMEVLPKATYSNPRGSNQNPSMDHMIDLLLEDKMKGYATSVIKYYMTEMSN